MTHLPQSPREPEADLGQVVDDVEQIAPMALLLAVALAGIAGTGDMFLPLVWLHALLGGPSIPVLPVLLSWIW